MGNAGLAGSTSPSMFVKTKTKKFRFIKLKKRKPINFNLSATRENADELNNSVGAVEYADKYQSSPNTCDIHEEPFSKTNTRQLSENCVVTENIPVVVTSSTFLHGSDYEYQHLPLGIIVSALFRRDNWLYVRTTHGQEGYIAVRSCLPLEVLSLSSHTTERDAAEFEQLKLLYKWDFSDPINYGERNVDMLYLQATGTRRRKQSHSETESENNAVKLSIKNDFTGIVENTISVRKGDIVFLLHNRVVGWFWVKNEVGHEGFIPVAVAGYVTNET